MPNFRALTDFAGVINDSGRIDVETGYRLSARVNRLSMFANRLARRVKDLEHAQAVLAVGPRILVVTHAFEKMHALQAKWLVLAHYNDPSFRSPSDGNPVDPINAMRIQNEFLIGLSIIEHGHLAVADDDQLLFFERVQPTQEDVRLDAARKAQNRQRDIGNRMVQIAGPLRSDRGGHFIQQVENGGNVVRSKTPKNVFFCSEFAEVQPGRADVFNLSQFALLEHAPELDHCGMIVEQVPDHQNARVCARQVHQFFPFFDMQREWLLDEHILPCQQSSLRKLKVLCRRRRYRHRVDFGNGEQFLDAYGRPNTIVALHLSQAREFHIADGGQTPQFVEITHEV